MLQIVVVLGFVLLMVAALALSSDRARVIFIIAWVGALLFMIWVIEALSRVAGLLTPIRTSRTKERVMRPQMQRPAGSPFLKPSVSSADK